jgi:AcrR family transcriptional regulator
MPRPAAEPIDLKEACVRAAREVIAEHGVERLSLRDVARRLGVSHQAPYKHYPSRDHLLAEVIRRCFREFAEYLDGRRAHGDPRHDLAALGERYLYYAARHPLEYRLMFGTPWPEPAEQVGVVRDAVHAFDVLRRVLRRVHGDHAGARERVDLDAMFIWANMHGLAAITQSDVMRHLALRPRVPQRLEAHAMAMLDIALRGALHSPESRGGSAGRPPGTHAGPSTTG